MHIKHFFAAASLAIIGTGAVAAPEFWVNEWPNTDFETTSVDSWIEIMGGGPPRDGIPALDDPQFIKASAETRIDDREPVVTVEIAGAEPRTYPLRYLVWHEIVNDQAGGIAFAVTYCPLCNSVPVFSRVVDGKTLTFGVSGKLRQSNLIMFDRETESWWQQATGEGIVGYYTDRELEQIPSWQESFAEYKARNPEGLVMDEPNWPRSYGSNPYVGYDQSSRPFLFSGEMPPHDIPALARVVRVGERAWPIERLRTEPKIDEAGLVLSWASGQASALDTRRISSGRDIGTIRVRDNEGNDVPHDIMFAFSFHSFWPEGEWMLGN